MAMASTPPDLAAILESIRARMAGEAAAAVQPASAPRDPPAKPAPPDLRAKTARLVPEPLIDGSGVTLEAVFAAVLEPMLRQWLDANLPEICERVARAEVRRLTGGE